MKVINIKSVGEWKDAYSAAMTTCKGTKKKDPNDSWKKKMLLAEHSVIRTLSVSWVWVGIPYWVSVHFTRHNIGITHFVTSQRTDITGINREKLTQNELVNHECLANYQALLNISRKRLCGKASKETTNTWRAFLGHLRKEIDPILADVCVPECIYRGFCPERMSCGYAGKFLFSQNLKNYREF